MKTALVTDILPSSQPHAKKSTEEWTLRLSNGMRIAGRSIGAPVPSSGELVFTTGMVGYPETLTDPSYYGQILVFTYPLIGNYGVPSALLESKKIHAAGVILSHDSASAHHWESVNTISSWLKAQGVPALAAVDTRELTQIIRNSSGLLASLHASGSRAWKGSFYDPSQNLILPEVSTRKRQILGKGKKRIALVDCGVKWSIVRALLSQECEVELLPWDTDFSQVDCSAWLLSNGPGDPKNTGDLVPRVRTLLSGRQPVFGICLGYQLLALAAGADTYKLQFGHRGHNQPVMQVGSRRGFMTSQNHGYGVDENSLPEGWKPWFKHVNDGSLEGIRHDSGLFSGVQFHPEAAAGPWDTAWLIEDFVDKAAVK